MNGDSPFFPCGKLLLEGRWHIPGGQGPFPAVVVCHPHPLFGGDMSGNVVLAVCQHLEERGFAAFRFNFRGVGRSQGHHGHGKDERMDVGAALDFVSQDSRVDKRRLGLAGYSFGAGVALHVASKDERIGALALISPRLKQVESDLVRRWKHPQLLAWGAEDEFAPTATEDPGRHSTADQLVMPGTDHFWVGHEDRLGETVTTFFVTAFVEG